MFTYFGCASIKIQKKDIEGRANSRKALESGDHMQGKISRSSAKSKKVNKGGCSITAKIYLFCSLFHFQKILLISVLRIFHITGKNTQTFYNKL